MSNLDDYKKAAQELNNQPVERRSDETRLSGELITILKRQIGECEKMYQERTKKQILAWHETEKQNILKQIWNLSQPDIVPDGWKPETKLSKWLKDNIK